MTDTEVARLRRIEARISQLEDWRQMTERRRPVRASFATLNAGQRLALILCAGYGSAFLVIYAKSRRP